MGGHVTSIEGKAVTYFVAGSRLAAPCLDDIVGFDVLEDRYLQHHPRLRRVLTTLVRPKPTFLGVLHWSDGTNLDTLDEKVISDATTERDFAGALLAEPRTIVCRNCEAQLRVLAVDTGQALFAQTLPDRLRAHELIALCEVCGTALGVPIVEMLRYDTES